MNIRILLFILLSCTVLSCKKIIEIDTENAPSQLVIEGQVSNRDTLQFVFLSKTVAYTEPSIYPKVSNAIVTVSDDRGNLYTYNELAPGVYAKKFSGIQGRTYTLAVKYNNTTYTASNKMPNAVALDSLTLENNNFFGNEVKTLRVNYVDPKESTDFYQFNLFVNDEKSQRVYVNNDRLSNGLKISQSLYFDNEADDDDLKAEDRILVEMKCIDENIYKYWFSLDQQTNGGPNQKTTPANPPSNISNHALGYFSAYALTRMGITVK